MARSITGPADGCAPDTGRPGGRGAALLALSLALGAVPPGGEASPGADDALIEAARSLAEALAAGDCGPSDAAVRFSGNLADAAPLSRARVRAVLRQAAEAPAVCAAQLRSALAQLRRAEDASAGTGYAPPPAGRLFDRLQGVSEFRFAPGDVLLLRSGELLSAAVSQVGLHHAFFSHAALVGLDPQWNTLEVVESVVDEGLRTLPLEEWLDRPFVRFAVWRPRDAALARRAAIAAYADAVERRGAARRYDLALSLDDHARLYCSEVITQAFARAAPGDARVPAWPSSVGALLNGFPLADLGMRDETVFLPDDIELDGRFEPVVELRASQEVAQAEAMDRVLRRMFDGLRGGERERVLAAIDGEVPTGPIALPVALRSNFSAYRKLPEPSRTRLLGLVRLVERELAADPGAAAVAAAPR